MSTWDATTPIKTVRQGYFPSTENASRTLPGVPPKVPYPELTYTMPPMTAGPPPSSDPPRAFPPFTASWSNRVKICEIS